MQLQTTIQITPLSKRIDHREDILSLGSCFADNMAQRLARYKFRVTASPTGILFNPASIASLLELSAGSESNQESLSTNNKPGVATIKPEELFLSQGRWSHFDFHSSFSHSDANIALEQMNQALKRAHTALESASWIIITFGTAFTYRHIGLSKIVANCHRQAASLFSREMLSAEDIATRYITLLQGVLRHKQVIFTVSPIRHLSDGLADNSLSKATLRVAIGEICRHCDNAHYFPSYEIMMDELRDYRFYADDMTHPTPLAIDYIWQRFSQGAISPSALTLFKQIDNINTAASHRPFDAQSEEYRKFCQRTLQTIDTLEAKLYADAFAKEKVQFLTHLQNFM